jgi:hypothetical protein
MRNLLSTKAAEKDTFKQFVYIRICVLCIGKLAEISQSVNEANLLILTIFFLRHTLVHLRGV